MDSLDQIKLKLTLCSPASRAGGGCGAMKIQKAGIKYAKLPVRGEVSLYLSVSFKCILTPRIWGRAEHPPRLNWNPNPGPSKLSIWSTAGSKFTAALRCWLGEQRSRRSSAELEIGFSWKKSVRGYGMKIRRLPKWPRQDQDHQEEVKFRGMLLTQWQNKEPTLQKCGC